MEGLARVGFVPRYYVMYWKFVVGEVGVVGKASWLNWPISLARPSGDSPKRNVQICTCSYGEF